MKFHMFGSNISAKRRDEEQASHTAATEQASSTRAARAKRARAQRESPHDDFCIVFAYFHLLSLCLGKMRVLIACTRFSHNWLTSPTVLRALFGAANGLRPSLSDT